MRTRTLIAVSFGFLVLFAFVINSWSRLETLTCERDQIGVRCTVTRDSWFSLPESTTYDDLVDVRANNFNRSFWAVTLTQRDGSEDDVAKEIREVEAKRVARWFAQREPEVQASRGRYPWHLTILGLVLLFVQGVFVWGWRFERNNSPAISDRGSSRP